MLRVTPLYGSQHDIHGQSEEPVCTLIEFAGRRVLVNVGWNPTFNYDDLPDHDCLLLTDSTLRSIGSLPSYYNASRRRRRRVTQQQQAAALDPLSGGDTTSNSTSSRSRILATFPTVKMGQMTLYDQHSAMATDGGTPPFTLDDLDDVFSAVEAIKYSQTIVITGDRNRPAQQQNNTTNKNKNNTTNGAAASVAITAFRAGHVVGGAFYVLKCLQDDTVILVADNVYNISKEQHLDNTTLLKHSNPNVLITRPGGPAFRPLRTLPLLQEKGHGSGGPGALTESILSVLRRDGNVLLPVDCAGRVLELLVLLDKYWDKQRLSATYNLIWVAPMGANVLDFARSQLEWMSAQKMGAPFDSDQGHPLKLPCVRVCSSSAELEALLQAQGQNPSCILASGLTLEGTCFGFAMLFGKNSSNSRESNKNDCTRIRRSVARCLCQVCRQCRQCHHLYRLFPVLLARNNGYTRHHEKALVE
jgi:cleavage and polyadenylation specificity factor subunit 2